MTGYGIAEKVLEDRGVSLCCEVKSLNHRFFELSAKLPKPLLPFESEIKKMVRKILPRGYITLKLTVEGGEDLPPSLKIDEKTADAYYSLLNELKLRYGLPGEVDLGMLVIQEGVIKEEKEEVEELWEEAKEVLDRALQSVHEMRVEEGERICVEMKKSLQAMQARLAEVESRAPLRVKEKREKLLEKMRLLLENVEVESPRLEEEVVLFSERCDISEEVSRLKGHIEHFNGCLEATEPIGRRLNFLLQEMHREANTMAVKSYDAAISTLAVGLKEETEKLREQVSNIE